MLRYSLLVLFICFLCMYSWKDWFKTLCLLIVMMAFLERPDMPKSMLGIPGLNPFNIVLGFILASWSTSKKREERRWDMPPHIFFLISLYFSLITVAVIRMLLDTDGLFNHYYEINARPPSKSTLFIDHYVNCVKWIIPGVLVYDGCRDREKVRFVIYALLTTSILIALQVIKKMGFGALTDENALQQKAVRVLEKGIGYHRVDLAALLAGAAWAFFSARLLFESEKFKRLVCLGMSGVCVLALILTAGRTGYGSWAIIGAIFALFRWRSLLLIGPLVVLIAVMVIPAAKDRLFEGFTEDTHEKGVEKLGIETVDSSGRDMYAITSGRAIVWPYVFEKIEEAPIFGYGTHAFMRTGISVELYHTLGAVWGHPHNAYLQLLLDAGMVGLIPILWFFVLILHYSFKLFRRNDKYSIVVGGTAFSFVLAQLIASFGAQSFYPREGVVLMWVAIGLCLRLYFFPKFAETEIVSSEKRRVRIWNDSGN